MVNNLSDRKKRLDHFDKLFNQDLDTGVTKEDSRLRLNLSEVFDREMNLAEKSFARGDYLDALEHREKANHIYAVLKTTKL